MSRYFRRPHSVRETRTGQRKLRQRPLRLEALENRIVLTALPYMVTTTADIGAGSLRDAITQINLDTNHALYASPGNPGVDEIDFKITADSDTGGNFNAATGVATITPQTALPTLTNSVIINGYSQLGSHVNTNGPGLCDNAVLTIELDGSQAGTAANGLLVAGGNSTIRGLVINRFAGNGVELSTNDSNTIEGTFIGIDPLGKIAKGNGLDGVYIGSDGLLSSNNNTIGGLTAAARNVLSGNRIGIHIEPSNGNFVEGNFIGTDVTGKLSLGNTLHAGNGAGVNIDYSGDNMIGGLTAEARNLISGNFGGGVSIYANPDPMQNKVQGNFIGTDVTGTSGLANDFGIQDYSGSVIGGLTDINGPGTGAGNLISGNINNGVFATNGGTVQGNLIGTDVTGKISIKNLRGVFLGTNETLGGLTAGARNIISGNLSDGVYLVGQNVTQGNYIGTDITGTQALGNGANGVSVDGGSNNTIGGVSTGLPNTIAYNGGDGVLVTNNANSVSILGNSIHDNAGLGIHLASGGNDNQVAPVLIAATSGSGSTHVGGDLASVPNSTFTVEFFADSALDPSGYGEGERFLSRTTVNTNGSGDASFSVTFPTNVPVGQFITATATDAANNTSEFSAGVVVSVKYNSSGFLAPVSLSRAFKQGSTIPIKWQVTDGDGHLLTDLGAIQSLTVTGITSGTTSATLYPGNNYSSGATGLRNDGGQYIYNWQTKGFGLGQYKITATLNDTSHIKVTSTIQLMGARIN